MFGFPPAGVQYHYSELLFCKGFRNATRPHFSYDNFFRVTRDCFCFSWQFVFMTNYKMLKSNNISRDSKFASKQFQTLKSSTFFQKKNKKGWAYKFKIRHSSVFFCASGGFLPWIMKFVITSNFFESLLS